MEAQDKEEQQMQLSEQELRNLQEFDEEKTRLSLVFLSLHEQIDQIRNAVRNNETVRQRYIDGIAERYHIPAGKKWAIRSDGVIEIEGSSK